MLSAAGLAVARSRVQGVTAGKALALPMYVPVAAWWLTGTVGWILAPFPTYWILRFWADGTPADLLAGLLCLSTWLIPLARHVLRSLDGL